jgi:hypothetical protein
MRMVSSEVVAAKVVVELCMGGFEAPAGFIKKWVCIGIADRGTSSLNGKFVAEDAAKEVGSDAEC